MANKKSIPSPPGGQLVCADDQLAIVEVRNGEIFAECHSQPMRLRAARHRSLAAADRTLSVKNWVLEQVTGERRATLQSLSNHDIAVLADGRFHRHDKKSGAKTMVEFKLPSFLIEGSEGA